MRFVFTADVHLSRYGQDKVEKETGLPEKVASIKKVLYQIAEYCVENKIEYYVISGDTYHTKAIIHVLAQDILFDFIDSYPQLKFVVIDGNHDLSDKGEVAISALKPLKKHTNVIWVENKKPIMIDNVYFVPYSHNVKELVKQGKADILVSHFGLNEGILNSGISIVSEIKMKDLQQYKIVLLGHYHKPQEVNVGATRAFYVGSPIQLDWGEKGDEKRFLVVDSETLEIQSIPTEGYKKHIELEINKDNKGEVLKEATQILVNGDYVKLIKTDEVDLSKQSEQFSVVDKSEKDITDRGITSNMSQAERMARFLEIKKIPEDDIAEYMGAGLGIISKVERVE